jgi:hypothetical protein
MLNWFHLRERESRDEEGCGGGRVEAQQPLFLAPWLRSSDSNRGNLQGLAESPQDMDLYNPIC